MNKVVPSSNGLERMIRQQVMDRGISDPRVLSALRIVPRDRFFPSESAGEAYADRAAPIGHGQTISQPYMVALMSERLDVQPTHRVLEIGTGSGYLTALLASGAGDVTSVEIDAATAADARAKLARHGFSAVRVEAGDGARGFGSETYDVIVLTGSTPLLPERFFEQLAPGGRLFAVVGEAPAMAARLVRAEGAEARIATDLFETVVAPLVNALAPARFEF